MRTRPGWECECRGHSVYYSVSNLKSAILVSQTGEVLDRPEDPAIHDAERIISRSSGSPFTWLRHRWCR